MSRAGAWESILNNVENLQKAFGREHTQIEVVAHGKGLSLLLATNAPLKERLQKDSESEWCCACENTIAAKNVKKMICCFCHHRSLRRRRSGS